MTDEKKKQKQFENFKKEEIRIAKELCYPTSVRTRIANATSEGEIIRIMKTAREKGEHNTTEY